MTILTDVVVEILRDYISAYCEEADNSNRELYAARLVGALDLALATAEVKDGD